MHKFKIGEVATVHNFLAMSSYLEGRDCTVVEIGDYGFERHIYKIEIQGVPLTQNWYAREVDLRKKKPPEDEDRYTGNDVIPWDQCDPILKPFQREKEKDNV